MCRVKYHVASARSTFLEWRLLCRVCRRPWTAGRHRHSGFSRGSILLKKQATAGLAGCGHVGELAGPSTFTWTGPRPVRAVSVSCERACRRFRSVWRCCRVDGLEVGGQLWSPSAARTERPAARRPSEKRRPCETYRPWQRTRCILVIVDLTGHHASVETPTSTLGCGLQSEATTPEDQSSNLETQFQAW